MIYEIREVGSYYEDTFVVGYSLTAMAAVEAAEAHAKLPHILGSATLSVEVLRHTPLEDQEGLNSDIPDRVWASDRGWTGV